jgi:hypothetical protein
MVWACYLRRGIVYVPTEAKIKTGGYMDIDPVFVIPIHDTNGIRSALKEVIAKGNPVIPPILRDDYPEPCLLKYAGVKTWGAFAKGAYTWTMYDLNGQYKIAGKRKMRPRGWVEDPEQIVILPAGATADDACDQLIAMVQAKAATHRPS